MSIAGASIVVILLLLPGVFFFIGLASYERRSREIIRTSAVGEVAMAVAIAILIHTVFIGFLSWWGFRLSKFLWPLIDLIVIPVSNSTNPNNIARHNSDVHLIFGRLTLIVGYLATSIIIGFGFGLIVAIGIVKDWLHLRRLASHGWVYDIIEVKRRGSIVTAFVMTNIVEDSKVIMYKGTLHDIFLTSNSTISYLILSNSFKYYMTFKGGKLITSKQAEILESRGRPTKVWDRLFIDGQNIANVLFDSDIRYWIKAPSKDATKEVDKELIKLLQKAPTASSKNMLP